MDFVYSGFDTPLEGMSANQMSGVMAIDLIGINYGGTKNDKGKTKLKNKEQKEVDDAESKFLSEIFDASGCRRSCKEKLGGKGAGFRQCVRECKGKGIKKSKLKEMEAKTDAELVESIKDISKQRTAQSQDENNKKYIWIIVSSILAILIIVGIVFIVRSKQNA